MILPAAGQNVAGLGTGYGVVTINSQGAATVSGHAGDGSVFSGRTIVTADGQFPIYALVGSKKTGSLHGNAEFRKVPNLSDFDGSVGLSKAASDTSGNAPTQLFALVGARYTPPDKNTPTSSAPNEVKSLKLDVVSSSGNAVPLGLGTLSGSSLTLGSGTSAAKITIQQSSGVFTGKLLVSGTWQRVAGALLQQSNMGGGLVLPTQSSAPSPSFGSLTITPATP
jgi:hypothetical protein